MYDDHSGIHEVESHISLKGTREIQERCILWVCHGILCLSLSASHMPAEMPSQPPSPCMFDTAGPALLEPKDPGAGTVWTHPCRFPLIKLHTLDCEAGS